MAKLFHDIIFGPINSRRFGVSLGINTLPLENKVCNFNCIYCECGWTDLKNNTANFFSEAIITKNIREKFKLFASQNLKLDAITFAGNGEPTMHPKFKEIVACVKENRDLHFLGTPIIVLSNGFLLNSKKVIEGLELADECIMKLDAGTNDLFQLIDQPLKYKDLDWYVSKLLQLKIPIKIQTMFLKGTFDGKEIDNTKPNEINAWIKLVQKINPREVMLYTIDRTPPLNTVNKVEIKELSKIHYQLLELGINSKIYL
jgi:wyosine [tRNA(Phe)-imidazoG37] synthetase (radical SAM superfamily)